MVGFDRRTYALISQLSTKEKEQTKKYLLVVSMDVNSDGEEEFLKWYTEEHLNLTSNIPGWCRGSLFKLHDVLQLGSTKANIPTAYLAIHETSAPPEEVLGSPQYQAAITTPWREKVRPNINKVEVRSYILEDLFTI